MIPHDLPFWNQFIHYFLGHVNGNGKPDADDPSITSCSAIMVTTEGLTLADAVSNAMLN
jgi:hypothetical protein